MFFILNQPPQVSPRVTTVPGLDNVTYTTALTRQRSTTMADYPRSTWTGQQHLNSILARRAIRTPGTIMRSPVGGRSFNPDTPAATAYAQQIPVLRPLDAKIFTIDDINVA